MKTFRTIILTALITALVMGGLIVYKFGMINVSSHTDHYETTKNGVVISSEDRVETDEVNFDVTINERFNIFSR